LLGASVASDDVDRLLDEQIAYYRARASEYDETAPSTDSEAYERLRSALREFAPRGHVLELACGTGQWTAELAMQAASVTGVDASPEMLAINQTKVAQPNVRYVLADLFRWSPTERYDVVFFSAWLSHVPPQRFEEFWGLVHRCLSERGRVFFVDELPAVAAIERPVEGAPAPAVERRLTTGARFRAIKVLDDPDVLANRLSALGWQVEVHRVSWRLFFAVAARR
jgi:demethylmenaquinone methyltransferase/2-methoxy-6-polyprenyl-1,4-benzoquinol methylase